MTRQNIVAISRDDTTPNVEPQRFKVYTARQLQQIPQLAQLSEEQRFDMQVVASVLPFRVNEYVINELIDWSNIPADPIFQLTFPQRGMLKPEHFDRVASSMRDGADQARLNQVINEVALTLTPIRPGSWNTTYRRLTAKPCRGYSTNTVKRCSSSLAQDRFATVTAPSAFAGRSLSATRT